MFSSDRKRKAQSVEGKFKEIVLNSSLEVENGKWIAPAEGTDLHTPVDLPPGLFYPGYYTVGSNSVEKIFLDGDRSELHDFQCLFVLVSDSPFAVIQVKLSRSDPQFTWNEILIGETVHGMNVARVAKDGRPQDLPPILKRQPRYEKVLGGNRWHWVSLGELSKILRLSGEETLKLYLAAADERLVRAEDVTEYITITDLANKDKPVRPKHFVELTEVVWKLKGVEHGQGVMINDDLNAFYWNEKDMVESMLDHRKSSKAYRNSDFTYDPADIFLPAGLAINIMYLNQFGYAPRKFK
jgi:hypothetical protein